MRVILYRIILLSAFVFFGIFLFTLSVGLVKFIIQSDDIDINLFYSRGSEPILEIYNKNNHEIRNIIFTCVGYSNNNNVVESYTHRFNDKIAPNSAKKQRDYTFGTIHREIDFFKCNIESFE